MDGELKWVRMRSVHGRRGQKTWGAGEPEPPDVLANWEPVEGYEPLTSDDLPPDHECPVCGTSETLYDHGDCEEAQQVEPYEGGEG